jgi:hypothetical protein
MTGDGWWLVAGGRMAGDRRQEGAVIPVPVMGNMRNAQ